MAAAASLPALPPVPGDQDGTWLAGGGGSSSSRGPASPRMPPPAPPAAECHGCGGTSGTPAHRLSSSQAEALEVCVSPRMSSAASSDKIHLRLILVSGKTKEFVFSPTDSASDVAAYVYEKWPMDWEEEQVSSPGILRLIYQGRFLHGNVTLGALKLPAGRTTVMHLVARERLPEPSSYGQRNREKAAESSCCMLL